MILDRKKPIKLYRHTGYFKMSYNPTGLILKELQLFLKKSRQELDEK